jgi:hypothetical protein
MGVSTDGQRRGAVTGQLLGRLDRRPASDDRADVGVPSAVEIQDMAIRIDVLQKVRPFSHCMIRIRFGLL